MLTHVHTIIPEARTSAQAVKSFSDFDFFKAAFTGPSGSLTQAIAQLRTCSPQERPQLGKQLNTVKIELEALFLDIKTRLEAEARHQSLGNPIDPTLPAIPLPKGTRHPLASTRNRIIEIFKTLGFAVAEGSEVETEWYCFDALNTPDDHPARDMQDTFYFPKTTRFGNIAQHSTERYVLRTQTSTVQIRTLLNQNPPIRILAPGRCFRRDSVDATHSANFHQIEGLYVDKHVTVCDLKDLLEHFIHALFGSEAQIRLRPSFFPFTEPSFEIDMCLPSLGKLSNQWIEIMGCGMVDPKVFESVNYDPEIWSGYAFGMGIERIAMLLLEVDDIRYFYQNDGRFLKQF